MSSLAMQQQDLAQGPFRYRIYGLTVVSDFELAGLPAAGDEDANIEIVRARVDYPLPQSAHAADYANRGGEQFLAWAMVGVFRIMSDSRIEVDPIPGAMDRIVALPLLGTVLATLLHRRGLYVLHASAIAVDGQGVALLGDKGAGKSTTAATMIAAGHTLLADDVVALDFTVPGRPIIMPAFGQLKLWDDASASLPQFGQRNNGRLVEGLEKSSFGLERGFGMEPVPVARLYVLTRSEQPGAEIMAPSEGMAALMRFSYLGRFGAAGLATGIGPQFQRSAELAQSGKVRVLRVPNGLDRIGQIPGLISDDLAQRDDRGIPPGAGLP